MLTWSGKFDGKKKKDNWKEEAENDAMMTIWITPGRQVLHKKQSCADRRRNKVSSFTGEGGVFARGDGKQ